MSTSRTGIFLDDYLEYANSLPAELQRLLSTVRELDNRSQTIVTQTRESTKACLNMPSQHSNKAAADNEDTVENLLKEIEAGQESSVSLSTEKVLLAQQACDLVDHHVKRLDEDLNTFADNLRREGKIPQDEPATLRPTASPEKKRKTQPITPVARRFKTERQRQQETDRDRDRERQRKRERDRELMPPPGSRKKKKSTSTSR